MSTVPEITAKRVQVLELRSRLERIAIHAFEDACGHEKLQRSNRIHDRLAFVLAARADLAPVSELHGLVRLGRHAYARTSDVLHGRSSMVNVPQVVIEEWRATVESLEQLERLSRE